MTNRPRLPLLNLGTHIWESSFSPSFLLHLSTSSFSADSFSSPLYVSCATLQNAATILTLSVLSVLGNLL